jgi:hypothetical protein
VLCNSLIIAPIWGRDGHSAMQIWQDGCDRRAEIASFTPSPINRAVAGSDFPRTRLPECSYSPSSFAFCRTSFSSRERKLAVSAIVRPWAISFVTSLMSIADQARPSFASYLAGPACGINARNEHCSFPRKTRMALTLRPTGMSSPASKEPVEFLIYDDAEEVGRIYKIGGIGTPPDGQWSWSITVYVDPMLGIATSAKVATLEEAKAQLRQNWQRAKAHSRAYGRSGDADKAQGADT